MRWHVPRKKGNSLLSILFAITIAGVLVALVVSVSSKVMEASRAVSCVSNLRQIGVALHLYLGEHDGRYPPNRANEEYHTEENPAGIHHQDSLKAYLTPYPKSGTITAKMAGPFWCPADTARKHALAQHSYGANTYIGGKEPAEEQNIRREENPSKRLYLVDATRDTLSTCMFSHNIWPFNNGPLDAPDTDVRVDFRHTGNANGLFLDGHVATFTVEELRGQDPSKPISSP